jgi:ADP-ribose pyrophosphatase YjhB (NUDIX family)
VLIRSLEQGGPEPIGAPVRGIALLAQDAGGLFSLEQGRLAARRERGAATRLARHAASLAATVHGVVEDRPELERAWVLSIAAVGARGQDARPDAGACVRALARVADLALQLPVLPDDQWQAEMIAFADEGLLIELREACLDLAATALALAGD